MVLRSACFDPVVAHQCQVLRPLYLVYRHFAEEGLNQVINPLRQPWWVIYFR